MSAPAIPGFYYDPEKQKYFKIEEHGSPSNPYSRENIAKRRRAEERQATLAQESRLQQQQIQSMRPVQRWTRSGQNIPGYMNSREIGLSTPNGSRKCLETKLMRRQRVWPLRPMNHLEQLTAFAVDEYSNEAVLGTQAGLVSSMPIDLKDERSRGGLPLQYPVTRFTSQVSSISLSLTEEIKTLVCCSMGNEHADSTIHIGRFNRPDERPWGLEVHAVMKPRRKQALFCTTISKYTADLFAVGGENVIFVTGGVRESQPVLHIKSNCLAVEFLGQHTLAGGGRNGGVTLYDFRGDTYLQNDGPTVQHTSAITHLKQVDDHLLMVSGLRNSLAMYDLRNLRKDDWGATVPIVKYKGHMNACTLGLGFDVDPSRTVVAAAGDDDYVRLWSISTGEKLHARISEYRFDDNVVGLQFSREMDGLWIAGHTVEYWSI